MIEMVRSWSERSVTHFLLLDSFMLPPMDGFTGALSEKAEGFCSRCSPNPNPRIDGLR